MITKFSRLTTSIGIPLYSMYLPYIDTVTAGILIKAGTRHEIWPQEAGIAHALEHMRFQGTKEFPTSQDISAYIENVGGVINAWTSAEGTFFWQKVPADEFRRIPHLLSQQILYPLIPEEKIEIEMQNIVQEIRQAKDNPSHFALREFEGLVFSGHILGRDVLGTEESVTSFSRPDFFAFSDRLYLASEMAIIIVGNMAGLWAVKLFEDYLNGIKTRSAELCDETTRLMVNRKEKIYSRPIEQVHMLLGYPLGPGDSHSVASLILFSIMIGGGMSFPLFQIVRDKHGLCYQISCSIRKNRDHSSFYIYVGTDPKKYRDAEKLIIDIIGNYKKDEQLLERAKTLFLGRLAMLYEDPTQVTHRTALQILYRGKPKNKDEQMAEIRSTTIKQVEQAVDEFLTEERLTKVIVGPQLLTS